MAATDHLTAFFRFLVSAVESSPALDGRIAGGKVWTFPESINANGYMIEPGKVAITVFPGDSTGEEPIHNESTQTDIIATQFNIILETKISESADAFLVSESSLKTTLLDFEFLLFSALQNTALRTNATTHCAGWVVSGINRDVPVMDEEGEVDPEVRRTEIAITADVLLDRTDGPWR